MNDEAKGYADNYTVRPRSQSLQAVGYSYPVSRSPPSSAFNRQAGATMRIKLILFELKTVEDPKLKRS